MDQVHGVRMCRDDGVGILEAGTMIVDAETPFGNIAIVHLDGKDVTGSTIRADDETGEVEMMLKPGDVKAGDVIVEVYDSHGMEFIVRRMGTVTIYLPRTHFRGVGFGFGR